MSAEVQDVTTQPDDPFAEIRFLTGATPQVQSSASGVSWSEDISVPETKVAQRGTLSLGSSMLSYSQPEDKQHGSTATLTSEAFGEVIQIQFVDIADEALFSLVDIFHNLSDRSDDAPLSSSELESIIQAGRSEVSVSLGEHYKGAWIDTSDAHAVAALTDIWEKIIHPNVTIRAEPEKLSPKYTARDYDSSSNRMSTGGSILPMKPPKEEGVTRWIDIEDPSPEMLAHLQNEFKLCPRAIDRCLTFNASAEMVERSNGTIYISVPSFVRDPEHEHGVRLRETGVFIGPNFVLTLRPSSSKAVDSAREEFDSGMVVPEGPLSFRIYDTVLKHASAQSLAAFNDMEASIEGSFSQLGGGERDLEPMRPEFSRGISKMGQLLTNYKEALEELADYYVAHGMDREDATDLKERACRRILRCLGRVNHLQTRTEALFGAHYAKRAQETADNSLAVARIGSWVAPAGLMTGVVATFGKIISFTDAQTALGAAGISFVASLALDRLVMRRNRNS